MCAGEKLPVDPDAHLEDWRDPMAMIPTEGAAATLATSFGGSATSALAPQFNSGKAEKLPADSPVAADFSDSSESEDERVLGTFFIK